MIITLGDYIDAIEKNGWKQAFGQLWVTKDNEVHFPKSPKDKEIYAACAVGQALLNLNAENIRPTARWDQPEHRIWTDFEDRVVYLNDREHKSLKQIAKIVRKEFKGHLDIKLRARKLDANI